jgi:hypothetical protein
VLGCAGERTGPRLGVATDGDIVHCLDWEVQA